MLIQNHVCCTGCSDMMNQSLFLVGEIGGNDYNGPLLSGVPMEKIRAITPSVVAKISSTISVSISFIVGVVAANVIYR
jgi:hypothetical protein